MKIQIIWKNEFFFFKEGVVYILPEKLQEISSTSVTKAVQGLESIYMAHVKLYLTSIGIMIDCHK